MTDYVALLVARAVDEILPVTGITGDGTAIDSGVAVEGAAMVGEGAELAFDEASVAKLTQGVGSVIDQFSGGAIGSVIGKGFSGLAMRGWKPGTPDCL
ncbi:hypothetical protein ACFRQM_31875 [Streptomyces sp. NPDC056831]|uniref:hypothetical protein n=1 Tax=Streptomyces sp. NPDC056831 TaxID=3345954 RepID=UPI0036CFE431